MLQVEFTAADIGRTRVVGHLGPFAETALGVGALQLDRSAPPAPEWRTVAGGPLGPAVRDLGSVLTAHRVTQLDLFSRLDPACSVEFQDGEQAWLSLSEEELVNEIRAVRCPTCPLPGWLDGFDRAAPTARRLVTDLLRRIHDDAVAPTWPAARRLLEAERVRLQHELLTGGVDAMLSSLHPLATWDPPVLSLAAGGRWSKAPVRCNLGGRGLHIVPSMNCPIGPVPFFAEQGPGVLLCPVAHPVDLSRASPRADLAKAFGRTRAAVLVTIGGGCTTGQIAQHLGISAASASEHATVLRAAGLVRSRRERNTVRHELTALGIQLMAGSRHD